MSFKCLSCKRFQQTSNAVELDEKIMKVWTSKPGLKLFLQNIDIEKSSKKVCKKCFQQFNNCLDHVKSINVEHDKDPPLRQIDDIDEEEDHETSEETSTNAYDNQQESPANKIEFKVEEELILDENVNKSAKNNSLDELEKLRKAYKKEEKEKNIYQEMATGFKKLYFDLKGRLISQGVLENSSQSITEPPQNQEMDQNVEEVNPIQVSEGQQIHAGTNSTSMKHPIQQASCNTQTNAINQQGGPLNVTEYEAKLIKALSKANKNIEALEKEKNRLQAENLGHETKIENLSAENDLLRNELKGEKENLRQANDGRKKVADEKESLEKELKDLKQQSSSEILSLRSQQRLYLEFIESLKKIANECDTLKAEHKKVVDEKESLEKELKDLKQQSSSEILSLQNLKRLYSEYIEDLNEKSATLKAESEESAEKLKSNEKKWQHESAELNDEIKRLNDQINGLDQQVNKLQNDKKKLQQIIDEAASCKKLLTEAESEIIRLNESNEKLTNTINDLKAQEESESRKRKKTLTGIRSYYKTQNTQLQAQNQKLVENLEKKYIGKPSKSKVDLKSSETVKSYNEQQASGTSSSSSKSVTKLPRLNPTASKSMANLTMNLRKRQMQDPIDGPPACRLRRKSGMDI